MSTDRILSSPVRALVLDAIDAGAAGGGPSGDSSGPLLGLEEEPESKWRKMFRMDRGSAKERLRRLLS